MDRRHQNPRGIRMAALGGVAGPILFAALVVVGGALTEGYTHLGQKISELGAEGAQYSVLQNLNFILLGVSVIGFSWALLMVMGPPVRGALLVGYFGVVAVVHGLALPCDPGCKGETTIGLLHNVTGLSGFLAAILGMFLLASRWRKDPRWTSHAALTRGAAFAALGGLAWFVFTQAQDVQSLAGLAQRVFATALLVWIAGTAFRMYREAADLER